MSIIRVGFAVTFVVALAGLLVRVTGVRERAARSQGAAWGWALLFLLLTSSQLVPWYVIWALPFAWLLPRTPRLGIVWMSVVLEAAFFVTPRMGYFGASYEMWSIQIAMVSPALFLLFVGVGSSLANRLRKHQPLED